MLLRCALLWQFRAQVKSENSAVRNMLSSLLSVGALPLVFLEIPALILSGLSTVLVYVRVHRARGESARDKRLNRWLDKQPRTESTSLRPV